MVFIFWKQSSLGILLASFLILSNSQLAIASGQDGFVVQPTEEGLDLSALAKPGVTILPEIKPHVFHSQLPLLKLRDKIFNESLLREGIRNWSEFDRDALYIELRQAGSGTIDRLQKKHSGLARSNLETAQRLIAKEESSQ